LHSSRLATKGFDHAQQNFARKSDQSIGPGPKPGTPPKLDSFATTFGP
jgi:hypothetical protein